MIYILLQRCYSYLATQLATVTAGKSLEDQEMAAWLPEKAQCIFCWIFVSYLILKKWD